MSILKAVNRWFWDSVTNVGLVTVKCRVDAGCVSESIFGFAYVGLVWMLIWGSPVHSDHWTGRCISRKAEAAVAMVTAWQAVRLYAVCWCAGEWGVYIFMLYTGAADMNVPDQHYSHAVSACVSCLWSAHTVYSLHHTECESPSRQARQACQKLRSLSKSVNDTVYRFDISSILKLVIWNILTSKVLKPAGLLANFARLKCVLKWHAF